MITRASTLLVRGAAAASRRYLCNAGAELDDDEEAFAEEHELWK